MEKKGACMTSEGLYPRTAPHVYTANYKAADIMQTTEILVRKVLKSWGGLNLKCHVPHELSIIRNLSSPPSFSNASLVRNARHSFFYGLPNSKNLATGHITQFPVIGEEFPSGFELSRKSDLPSITASSRSSLLNDHVRRRRCFPLILKDHSSKRNNSSPSHGGLRLSGDEVRSQLSSP